MFADEHGFAALVRDLQRFYDDSVSGPFGVVAFLFDGDRSANCVADENRFDESQSIVAVTHSLRIDYPSRKANTDREDERAMRHPLTERLGTAPLGVHVMGKEVTGLSGVEHNVGLGDSAAAGLACVAGCVVFKKQTAVHVTPINDELQFRKTECMHIGFASPAIKVTMALLVRESEA
jgi:hypothetical protein